MSTFRRLLSSSVGTKLLVGLTGLALFAYLILHLVGNALIFAGPETFNAYSHALISNPLILPIEVGLLAVFLLHVYKAVTNYAANQAARPTGYAMKKYARHTSRKSLASSTMIWSGVIIFLFITECYGTVARVRSTDGETATDFTTASEYRRLAAP